MVQSLTSRLVRRCISAVIVERWVIITWAWPITTTLVAWGWDTMTATCTKKMTKMRTTIRMGHHDRDMYEEDDE